MEDIKRYISDGERAKLYSYSDKYRTGDIKVKYKDGYIEGTYDNGSKIEIFESMIEIYNFNFIGIS